jgi:hypothetical protein
MSCRYSYLRSCSFDRRASSRSRSGLIIAIAWGHFSQDMLRGATIRDEMRTRAEVGLEVEDIVGRASPARV